MITTEKMRKVSIIIHQRRLAGVLQKLGETKLIHIIKKRSEIINPKQITENIAANLEKVHELQEKVKGIITPNFIFEEGIRVFQFNFEGFGIEEIIANISNEIEEMFTKKDEIITQINEIDHTLSALISTEQLLHDLLQLKLDFSQIKETKNILLIRIGYILTKNVELFKRSLGKYPHLYEDQPINEENSIFIASVPRKYRDDIRNIENEYHTRMIENFDEIHLEDYQKTLDEVRKLEQEKISLNDELLSFLKENFSKLSAFSEVLNNLNSILRIENELDYKSHFVTIDCWVSREKVDYLMNYCNEITEKTAILFISEDYNPEEPPPSNFKNPKIFQPFETLTQLYGIPNYKEIDPTMILTLSFPVIFGFMFGDIGHGVMLITGAILLLYLKKNITKNWRNLLFILIACGIFSTITGFLYGEAFGMDSIFGIHLTPLLFSPFHNITSALKFSVIVGTVMLSLGFGIEAINLFRKKERADSFLVAIPKIFIVVGAVYMVFRYKFDIQAWLQGPLYILIIPAVILIFGRLATHLLSFNRLYREQSSTNLLGSGLLEGWETILSVLSNIPSFCRIFALSVVHFGLTYAVILLSDMAANVFFGPLILIVGNVAVVLFEMLLAFIHSLRLHYVEFFGKFYKGDGVRFIPFSVTKKFSALQFRTLSSVKSKEPII